MSYGRYLSSLISVQIKWRRLEISENTVEVTSEGDLRALIEFAYLDSRRHSISWSLAFILNKNLLMHRIRDFLYVRAPRWDVEVCLRNWMELRRRRLVKVMPTVAAALPPGRPLPLARSSPSFRHVAG